jgi:hypothetical protein
MKMHIYLMAGMATSPNFMERVRVALQGRLEQSGKVVHSELLFPYGDNRRRLIPQAWEIRHDMRLRFRRIAYSIGGNRVLTSIQSQLTVNGEDKFLFVGHSGGGVAAVHTAKLLLERQHVLQPFPVVMVGSPRCRIPDEMQNYVLSLHAAGKSQKGINAGISPDVVTRLGTFGGWTAGLRRFPSWQVDKHAPANIRSVPIIGGHADYFRDCEPYVNPMGTSNLDITLEAIDRWLSRWK